MYTNELVISKVQENERLRISADIHDELGSGITAIRLMSEIARKKMNGNVMPELERISVCADDLMNKINAIIWSMDAGNDHLENLVSYIKVWALDYFEITRIRCVFKTAGSKNPFIAGITRRNLFFCVKELLANILKHSNASEVTITVELKDQLIIEVKDNGIGIEFTKTRIYGNGLKNIRNRMESIGGDFKIEKCEGTTAILFLRLKSSY